MIVSTVDATTEVAAVVTDETTPVDAVGDATGSSPVKAPKAGPYLLVGSEGAGSPAMLVSAGANSDTGSLKLVVAVPTGEGSFCKLSGTAPAPQSRLTLLSHGRQSSWASVVKDKKPARQDSSLPAPQKLHLNKVSARLQSQ